jgi:hypothetical protein
LAWSKPKLLAEARAGTFKVPGFAKFALALTAGSTALNMALGASQARAEGRSPLAAAGRVAKETGRGLLTKETAIDVGTLGAMAYGHRKAQQKAAELTAKSIAAKVAGRGARAIGLRVASAGLKRLVPYVGTGLMVKDAYDLGLDYTKAEFQRQRMANFKSGKGYRLEGNKVYGETGEPIADMSEKRSAVKDNAIAGMLVRQRAAQRSLARSSAVPSVAKAFSQHRAAAASTTAPTAQPSGAHHGWSDKSRAAALVSRRAHAKSK